MSDRISLSLSLSLSLVLVACTSPSADAGDTSTDATETAGESETGATDTTETGDDQPTRGLPEGESSWEGTVELNDFMLDIDMTLTNTGGDLEATFSVSGIGDFVLTGTHEPSSGLVALAPDDWVSPPSLDVELFGFVGTVDPDGLALVGMSRDFASGAENQNTLTGGPGTLTLISGDGPPTTVGDEAASLGMGMRTFTGTSQCSSAERQMSGTITYDGAGGISGSLTLGDNDLATPLGTFEFTGVHNPSTGGFTLVPELWIDPNHTSLTFFVDGTFDAATSMADGDIRTNTNACIQDGWHALIE